jgi:hypothetical protein
MNTERWRRKLQAFRALDGPDKWMLLHAATWLAVARFLLLVLQFRQLAKRLSAKEHAAETGPDPELLRRIGYAVRAAAGNVPWRSDCFPQSIAGWMLLKHHGYKGTIHLGVDKKGDDNLVGHAWLTCSGTVVTGGEDLDRYAEIHRLGA